MKLHSETKESPVWTYHAEREALGRGIVCLVFLLAIMIAYGVGQASQQGKINDLRSALTVQQWETEDMLRVVSHYTCAPRAMAETPYTVGFWSANNDLVEGANLLVVCETGKYVDPVKFQQFVCNTGQASYVLNKSNYCRP